MTFHDYIRGQGSGAFEESLPSFGGRKHLSAGMYFDFAEFLGRLLCWYLGLRLRVLMMMVSRWGT